jgi:membrane protease YdiL (CAAX protease family)
MEGPDDAGWMSRRRLVGIAVGGEGLLAVCGLGILWWRTGRAAVAWGDVLGSLPIGAGVAGALAVALYVVLHHAPGGWLVRSLRRTYREVLRPIFGGVGPLDVAVIAAAAGFGEEILFRAALQPILGLVATSVLFGLVHVFGRDSIPIGLWASGAGLLLGWLAIATGGLTAPVVAHAVYDALALALIRWGPEPEGN